MVKHRINCIKITFTCENSYERTTKLTENVSQYFSWLTKPTISHSDGNCRIDMTACEGSGCSDTEIQETADEECPVRVRYHFRSGSKILSCINSIGEKESTNRFEDEYSHALSSERGRKFTYALLNLISFGFSNGFHLDLTIEILYFIQIIIYHTTILISN